ncbi:MAG: hypothetical protein IH840_11755, partial [Candidatus Heimdallarchaeota archaeon]|nr:hypothetical protein [Candidatus Heimdallarchaeota archaeon]
MRNRWFSSIPKFIIVILLFMTQVFPSPLSGTAIAFGGCSFEPIPFLSKSGRTHLIVTHPIDHGDYFDRAHYHLREDDSSWSTPIKLVETAGLVEPDPQGELLHIDQTNEGFDVYFFRDSYIKQGDYGLYRQSYNELTHSWAIIEPLVTGEELFGLIGDTPDFNFSTDQVGLDHLNEIDFFIRNAEFLLLQNGSFIFGWTFGWFDNQQELYRYPHYIFTYHSSEGLPLSHSFILNIDQTDQRQLVPTLNIVNQTLTAFDNVYKRKWGSDRFNFTTGFNTTTWSELEGMYSGTSYQEQYIKVTDGYIFAYNSSVDGERFLDVRNFNNDKFNMRLNISFTADIDPSFKIESLAFEIDEINTTSVQFGVFAVIDGSVQYFQTNASHKLNSSEVLQMQSEKLLHEFLPTERTLYDGDGLFDIEYVKLGTIYKLFWSHPLQTYSGEIVSIEFDGTSVWSDPVVVTDCSTFTHTEAD